MKSTLVDDNSCRPESSSTDVFPIIHNPEPITTSVAAKLVKPKLTKTTVDHS